MLRRLAVVLAGALVAATLAVSSATPASAQQVCAGQGVANVGSPMVYPIGPAVVNASFGFSLDVGVCLPGGTLSAGGRVNGHCGLSNGFGTTNSGANFTFTGIGSMLLITGDITGAVNATPDLLTGHSCLSGATRFLVTGGGIDA